MNFVGNVTGSETNAKGRHGLHGRIALEYFQKGREILARNGARVHSVVSLAPRCSAGNATRSKPGAGTRPGTRPGTRAGRKTHPCASVTG